MHLTMDGSEGRLQVATELPPLCPYGGRERIPVSVVQVVYQSGLDTDQIVDRKPLSIKQLLFNCEGKRVNVHVFAVI